MATNKPFNFDITTAVRDGVTSPAYRFLRSVFKGKPAIFTAQDLNRQFEQIITIQGKHSEHIGAVLVNAKFTSDNILAPTTTHSLTPNDGVNPIYVYAKGMRFKIPTYTFQTTGLPSSNDFGLYVIARRDSVSYAEDFELSGIDIPVVPYNSESSETIVYVDERVVYGDINAIPLGVNEEFIAKIAVVGSEINRSSLTIIPFMESVPPSNFTFLRPICISDTELNDLSIKYTGSHFDYYAGLYDVTIQRFRSVISYFKSEIISLKAYVDAGLSNVGSTLTDVARLDTNNKFRGSNYEALTTNSTVSYYAASGQNPGGQVFNSLNAIRLDNTQGTNVFKIDFATIVSQGILPSTTKVSNDTIYIGFIDLVNSSVLEDGYKVILEFSVPAYSTRYLKFLDAYSPTISTVGKPFRNYLDPTSNFSFGVSLLAISNGLRLTLVYENNLFHVKESTYSLLHTLGYERGDVPLNTTGDVYTSEVNIVSTLRAMQSRDKLISDELSESFFFEQAINSGISTPPYVVSTTVTNLKTFGNGTYLLTLNGYFDFTMDGTNRAPTANVTIYKETTVLDEIQFFFEDIGGFISGGDNWKLPVTMVVPFTIASQTGSLIKAEFTTGDTNLDAVSFIGKMKIIKT